MSDVVSMFTGIGGLDLGFNAGFGCETALMCEFEPWKRRVLEVRFPGVVLSTDVRDLAIHCPIKNPLGTVGGYPCKGNSTANASKAKKGMLHPETALARSMMQVNRSTLPEFSLFENVPASRKHVLPELVPALDAMGYDAVWGTLKASDLGAPMVRNRLFLLALKRGRSLERLPEAPIADSWETLPNWSGPMPINDHWHKDRKAAVGAYGDAVVPLVAWVVGWRSRMLYAEGVPQGRPVDGWPMQGSMRRGGLFGTDMVVEDIGESPWAIPFEPTLRYFVKWRDPCSIEDCLAAPGVGVVVGPVDDDLDPCDCVDVMRIGGDVVPIPLEWLRPHWPAPTRHNHKDKGSPATWRRKSPGLDTLSHVDDLWWSRCETRTGDALLDDIGGTGMGPDVSRFAMGFPKGWHDIGG